MAFDIQYNEEKNQLLKATRGIGFEETIQHLKDGGLLDDKVHTVKNRPHQRLFIVKIDGYAYVVPYVLNQRTQEIFLKTVYPSRKFTKLYLKKGDVS